MGSHILTFNGIYVKKIACQGDYLWVDTPPMSLNTAVMTCRRIFPIRLIAGDDWHISDVPSGVLHFHNCLEIGLCESDSGKMDFAGTVLPFKKAAMSPWWRAMLHTTWSDPGCSSKWRYLFYRRRGAAAPLLFAIDKLPNTLLLSGLLNGWYGIFPPPQTTPTSPTACAR